jgi:hypothetical protein
VKKISLAVAAAALLAGPTFAAMQVHEYVYAITGPAGCKLPKDAANPKAGDCVIEKATYKTGKEIVKAGNSCIEVVRTVDHMQKMTMQNGWTVEEPQMHTSMNSVPCRP